MCGIVGYMAPSSAGSDVSTLKAMTERISARGPDDQGVWVDQHAGVFLGHRRLAILDVSMAGHQPMRSSSGRFVIAFNGEIYNHLELREELKACDVTPIWRGHSDTETLLAAFEHWGIESTLKRTVGMFAIALWDTSDRVLYLARDRFGEKPLYYGWVGRRRETFAFSSELKAFDAFPEFSNQVSQEALALYFRFMYVPAPYSIYESVFKLEPGCLLCISGAAPPIALHAPIRPTTSHQGLELKRWWSLRRQVEFSADQLFDDEASGLEALEQCLERAVRLQSIADVPLGAFLSGGIDSSTIVALLQKQSTRQIKTFTVGFGEVDYDEAPRARAVAQHLNTDHCEVYVTSAEALSVIPRLPKIYDEPFADSSQIPTYLISQAARAQVTVALSGDAGDELFGGYNRYLWGPRVWNHISGAPYRVRAALGSALASVPPPAWEFLSHQYNSLVPSSLGIARAGEKVLKLANSLQDVRDERDLYRNLISEWQNPIELLRNPVPEPPSLLDGPLPCRGADRFELQMMYHDSMSYLPDDILCKVDRAAMSMGLETRIPFLDHRVAEVAWRLPLETKIRNGQGKWPLRQILYKYVPPELIERPKLGFGVPLGGWLRGPLRDWAEDLLTESRLEQEGYLDAKPLRKAWNDHVGGRRDCTAKLWSVLMFEAWLRNKS